MENTRKECHYCFKTLDSGDQQAQFRTFVKCVACGQILHTACWNSSGECSRCGGRETRSTTVPKPPPLRVVLKPHPVPIRPSAIINLRGKAPSRQVTWRQRATHLVQTIQALAWGTLFIATATGAGAFAYRITHLGLFTLKAVMDALFKAPRPAVETFASALASGMICGLIFYTSPHSHSSTNENENVGGITKLMAVIVIITAFDIVTFNLNPQNLINFVNLGTYHEILYAQCATAFIVLILTPLYKKLVSITPLPQPEYPLLLARTYRRARLLLVALSLNLFAVYLSTNKLPPTLNGPQLAQSFLNIPLTLPMAGAFLSGLFVTSVAYWPPKSRQINQHLKLLRLIIAITSVLSVGLLYRTTENSEGLISAITIACISMILSIPVQRTIS